MAALGMVALLAGCANTPIAASIMSIELFGPALSPYAAVACIVSFLMVGHRSVYPSQVLSISKSGSIRAGIGKTIEDLPDIGYTSRPLHLMVEGEKILEKVRAWFNRWKK